MYLIYDQSWIWNDFQKGKIYIKTDPQKQYQTRLQP